MLGLLVANIVSINEKSLRLIVLSDFFVFVFPFGVRCTRCVSVVCLLYALIRSPNFALTFSRACSKSAIKSSGSSTPALTRIRESVTPVFIRSSNGIEACVMVAGWPIKDSTPPNDSARAKYFVCVIKNAAASMVSFLSEKENIPPKSLIWRLAISWPL